MTTTTPPRKPGTPDPAVAAPVESLFTACQLLTAAAAGITAQPDLTLDLIPTLPEAQALARSHAAKWSGTYQVALLQPLADILGYANAYTSYLPYVTELSGRIAAGDKAALPDLREVLDDLGQQASSFQAGTADSKTQLLAFKNLVDDDHVRFDTEAKALEKNYTGPSGEITTIRTSLAALEQRLQKNNAEIALGATKAIPGALVTGIELALSAEEVFGAAGTVIQAGLSLARSTAAWNTKAIADDAMAFFDEAKKIPAVYKSVKTAVEQPYLFPSVSQALDDAQAAMNRAKADIAEYGRELTQLTMDNLQAGVFITLQGQVQRLALRADDALAALDGMTRMWEREQQRLIHWDAMAQGTSADRLADEFTVAAAHCILNAQASRRFQDALVNRSPDGR
ncbi:HBL/NHE enterotoxin family protein [Streptomyces sp. KLMMK]|uniref:HBL/NHE enterotoxin family protein n=1 Tax=Streptomyces sp. KLMMK TaxID=3109353 RepID=UPI003000336A